MEYLEIFGVLFGLIGLVLMYLYSTPPIYKKSHQVYLNDDDEAEQLDAKDDAIEQHYKRMSAIGFVMTVGSVVISGICLFL